MSTMIANASMALDPAQRLGNGLKRVAAAQGIEAVLLTSADVAHELTEADGICALPKDRSGYLLAVVADRKVQSLPVSPSLQRLIDSATTANESIVTHRADVDVEFRPDIRLPADTFLTVPLGTAPAYLAIGYFWGAGAAPNPVQLALLTTLAWATSMALEVQQKTAELDRSRQRQHAQTLELQHRVRNVLALVRSLIRRSTYDNDSAEDFASHLEARVSAIARAQGTLAFHGHGGPDLEDLIRGEFTANAVRDSQFDISGGTLRLSARASETIALTLHELTMNALKFGALSQRDGHISIAWTIDSNVQPPRLQWRWNETGIDTTTLEPEHRGFGRELIEHVLPYELSAQTKLVVATDRVCCEIDIPLNERTIAAGTSDRKQNGEIS